MSDEFEFVVFPPEMEHEQRKPDNQGCWPHDDGQGDQRQIFFTGKKKTKSPINDLHLRKRRNKNVGTEDLLCVLDSGSGK